MQNGNTFWQIQSIIKTCCWPAGQSLYQHIHMEVLTIVYSHHIADENGCGVSDPVFWFKILSLHILLILLPRLISVRLVNWVNRQQQKSWLLLLLFQIPFPLLLLLTEKHPIWYQMSQLKSQTKERKNTWFCYSVCFLSEGMRRWSANDKEQFTGWEQLMYSILNGMTCPP